MITTDPFDRLDSKLPLIEKFPLFVSHLTKGILDDNTKIGNYDVVYRCIRFYIKNKLDLSDDISQIILLKSNVDDSYVTKYIIKNERIIYQIINEPSYYYGTPYLYYGMIYIPRIGFNKNKNYYYELATKFIVDPNKKSDRYTVFNKQQEKPWEYRIYKKNQNIKCDLLINEMKLLDSEFQLYGVTYESTNKIKMCALITLNKMINEMFSHKSVRFTIGDNMYFWICDDLIFVAKQLDRFIPY